MADSIFKKWDDKIDSLATADFKKGVLEAIHKLKEEIYDLKVDRYNHQQGRIIQDDNRIVLSAPEIIIGDVNLGGILNPKGGSKVIIRSNDVNLEGVGNAGQLNLRAPIIRQTGENPGVDGNEHVVSSLSQIVSQAGSITIQSDTPDKNGAFPTPSVVSGSGIRIKADHTLDISAVTSKENRTQIYDNELAKLEASKEFIDNEVNQLGKSFKTIRDALDKLLAQKEKIAKGERDIRSSYADLDELNDQIEHLSADLTQALYSYSNALSMQAENARLTTYFKGKKEEIAKVDKEKFAKISTNTSISIASEKISMSSIDEDGNIRTNPTAGISIEAQAMKVEGPLDQQGSLLKDNRLDINMRTVTVATTSTSNVERDNEDKLTKALYKAEGDFIVKSKNITLETVDYEVADKKLKEKGLTTDGKIKLRSKTVEVSTVNSSDVEVDEQGKLTKAKFKAEGDVIINSKTFALKATENELSGSETKETALSAGSKVAIRAEKIDFAATDTEGKATGSISANAKDIAVKSMDVEKENRTDNKLAEGGTMLLVSEKMTIGAKSKDVKSKSVLAQSEEITLQADKTVDIQQGEAKAEMKLAEGKATISADKAEITCETTIGANTEVKGTVKAPKGEFDNLKAKSSFNSPNISDGMGV